MVWVLQVGLTREVRAGSTVPPSLFIPHPPADMRYMVRAPAPPRKALPEPPLGREQGPSLLPTLSAEHLFSSGAGSLNSAPAPQTLLCPRHHRREGECAPEASPPAHQKGLGGF